MRALPVGLVSLLLWGCATTTRYRLPLEENPQRAAAEQCYAACQSHPSRDQYLVCLQACPGISVAPGQCNDDEGLPQVVCEEQTEQASLGAGLTVGGLVAIVVVAAVIVAAWPRDEEMAKPGR